jgi:EAL domain-containing protein (putative c-di-GMP-specific phosphodiesterase class I)
LDRLSRRILVLDDEPFMLRLLGHLLAELGFDHVELCDSGLDALTHVNAQGPDLILMDLNMPGMDGVEFVRKLVERGYCGNLILVSGEDARVLHMAEKLIRAHGVSLLGYLQKPFTRDRLAALLERSMRAKTGSRPPHAPYSVERIRDAIANGELINHYQPKVAVATGQVVGVETLVRWRHPEDGLVYPDQFIGVAEEHGLIDALTRCVLRGALTNTREWQLEGLALQVAINISMDNLSSVDFGECVAQESIAAGVAPQDIMLEVTESRLMLDQRAPLEVLTRLRMRRYGLSIDDFGTGHSSLALLRDVPFDELKIDRSFVHDAWRDPTRRAIYDASLALGKQLGMIVVAEGVEDDHDWDLARRTGCDQAQGYFIARPMAGDELMSWTRKWRSRVDGS